jgi:hypothetical protein
MKDDHLGIRTVEMMPANSPPHIFRDGDAAFLTGDVVNSLDFGCPAVTVSIADDQVLLGEGLGEVETTAEKRVPVNRRAELRALLRHASLDCGSHTRDVTFVLRTKVDRVPFQASQNDGLNQFGIIGHLSVFVLYHTLKQWGIGLDSLRFGEVSAET